MRLVFSLALALASLVLAAPLHAQPGEGVATVPDAPDSTRTVPTYTTGAGLAVRLTNDGFGVGGVLRAGIGEATSLLVELSVNPGKDEREQQFFIGLFGETVVPLKRNYFAMAPLHVGVEHRLFRATIEDNFRPFFQLTGGPTFGYQWPYFDDVNNDGIRDDGEDLEGAFGAFGRGALRFGVGGTLAVGAYFGLGRRTTQGLRLGYHAAYFFEPVDLLEADPRVADPSKQFFGTPLVSIHLLRLW
ncbi:MAG: hypothetical protein AAGG50_02130 [Bacteroidota bacterium]